MRLTRRGFSLAELLVATAIAGVVATAMTLTVVRQQRFFSSANEIISVRSQLRDAADVLASDIRGASVTSLGLPAMTDTAIELYTTIATSVACVAPVGTVIGLPPAALVTGHTLTSILAQPDTGDIALIYAADSARWESYRIAAFSVRSLVTSCPASSGFTTPGDNFVGATGYSLTLASTPGAGVRQGALIRFLRPARYSLYKSSDNEWYLGYRRCSVTNPLSCTSIQPVSGPYRAYKGAGSPSGIAFRYYDQNGGELTSVAQSQAVARVDIVLRGETSGAIALAGDSRRTWRDSVIVSVSPRNRAR
jgi:prepilin-type N-terminal cleavage/methylation domain-containing protein